jgi:hypothetical protein
MRIDNAGRVGIGRTPADNGTLFVSGSPVNNFSYNVQSTPTYGNTVMAEGVGYISTVNTAAAAFTLNAVQSFRVAQGTKGAGSTITNLFGYHCDNLTNGGSNFGFYSTVASGTGRYNFYAAGTADNYFAGKLGLGLVPSAAYGFYNALSITGATTAIGNYFNQQVLSDVTDAFGLRTELRTAAGAFTLTNLHHYSASQDTLGAGSTVTNQYGFSVRANLIGATNDFGFHSNIPSGAGRYNFYAAGTADNYFAGNTYTASGTTTMTSGFFYIPSAAGAPSGVPTAIAGRVPMYYDTTNNNFYVYNGAWKKVLLA